MHLNLLKLQFHVKYLLHVMNDRYSIFNILDIITPLTAPTSKNESIHLHNGFIKTTMIS